MVHLCGDVLLAIPEHTRTPVEMPTAPPVPFMSPDTAAVSADMNGISTLHTICVPAADAVRVPLAENVTMLPTRDHMPKSRAMAEMSATVATVGAHAGSESSGIHSDAWLPLPGARTRAAFAVAFAARGVRMPCCVAAAGAPITND